MNPRYLAIVPRSPLHLGRVKPAFNFLATRDVLPGSVVRGSLAEFLIRSGRTSVIKEVVKDLRISWFGPTPFASLWPYYLPATALQCKTVGGFASQRPRGHGVMDSLIPAVAYAELEDLGATFPVPFRMTCGREGCHRRMDRMTGWYVKEQAFEKVAVSRSSQTKVALSRRRRASELEMLYSVTALRPTVFAGKVWADDEVFKLLIEACQTSGIGGLTGRGYGSVEVREAFFDLESIHDRVAAFNQVLARVWQELCSIVWRSEVPIQPPGWYFSIDLISPAILRDTYGRPTLQLDLDLHGSRHAPIMFASSPSFEGGWSTAWGLPKEVRLAANLGSTYVFRVESETVELYESLDALEGAGVGDRRDEGYGDVLVCHPFHREVEQV
jgi:CRISPR-associated protein Csx10